jgi:hypothetical protein
LAGFPSPPSKLVPFNSGAVAAHDIGRQFDEHARAFVALLNFLRTVVRDDGMLRNGKIGPEQIDTGLVEGLSRRAVESVSALLEDTRAEARRSAMDVARMEALVDQIRQREVQITQAALAMQGALHETRARLEELSALRLAPTGLSAPSLPVGILGPGAGGFYGVDTLGALATAQDYAQVSIDWAEYMPGTIPPNTLAINAITGDHWSSRWWANRSANAFGMLAWWYQGAWPSPGPPSTPFTPTGQPLPVGSMYYATDTGAMMVWNGSGWVNSSAPSKAATSSLYYTASAGQTVFPLGTTDNNGKTFAFNQTAPEGLQALVNGVRVEPTVDFTVNTATSTVTFLRGLTLGSATIFDVLAPASQLTPSGSANTVLLNAIVPDGVKTVFTGLTVAMNGHATNIGKNEELLVSVDGVQQSPGVAYTASVSTLTFVEAPGADAKIFLIWFGPVNP